MKKFLLINGPNLNLLGTREPEVYGDHSFENILTKLKADNEDIGLEYFQSNIEGELIDRLQAAVGSCDGVILNAGGYSHTSVALRDTIAAIATPVVEVHMTNTASREEFRHRSLLSAACVGVIMGFGKTSYGLAVRALRDHLSGAK